MAVIQKKICMVGSFAVGKTSLVARFVKGIFSEKYLTTVGVKIDKRTVTVDDRQVNLMLWDLYGEDDFQKLKTSYLRGAAGYFLVVDGTRPTTLEMAIRLDAKVRETVGDVPRLALFNKADLQDQWAVNPEKTSLHIPSLITSAKTGQNVATAFETLARMMVTP